MPVADFVFVILLGFAKLVTGPYRKLPNPIIVVLVDIGVLLCNMTDT